MKPFWNVLLATALLVLGLLGLLMETIGLLPPEIKLPAALLQLLAIIPVLLSYLGWSDKLEDGKQAIIDLVKNFFKDPYRKLALTVFLALLSGVSQLPELPSVWEQVIGVVSAILAVLQLSGAENQLESEVKLRMSLRANNLMLPNRSQE